MLKAESREKSGGYPPLKDMEKILSSLANEDALKIFQEAKKGITNSSETIKKIGLTQKRYYARLKSLIEAGLVEKTDNRYDLTFLGKIIYEIVCRKLERTLKNRDRIALIDKLNKAETLSKEEKERLLNAISVHDKTIGYSGLLGGIKPVEVVTSYEDLKKTLLKLVNNAREEILLASRYTDTEFSDAFLKSSLRGVRLHVLDGDKKNLSEKFTILRTLLLNPKTFKIILELLNSTETTVKYVDLPYSFCIIDRRYVGIEVVNPLTDDFFIGFLFDNEEIAEKFVEVFNALSQKASDDPLKKFFDRFKKQSLDPSRFLRSFT